ncbi:MAG: hypothetical protein AB7E29_02435 [Xanthobacter sp.]
MKAQHIFATTYVVAGLFAMPALAADRKVDILNKTRHTITAFYASNMDEESWEADMLGGDGADHCVYNFKAECADDDSVIQRKINVCETAQFTFTP